MRKYSTTQIEKWFAYRDCSSQDIKMMGEWREDLTSAACDFNAYVADSDEKTYALHCLKAAMMAMNAALVAPMPKE